MIDSSILERPPMVASLSPSSMATWRQCPKRFFFEKILRIETETSEPAVCGSFVHLVLEHLMGRPGDERTIDTARCIATEVWPAFIADPDSRFGELELDAPAVKVFKRRAWEGISGYFRIEDPSRIEVVATEEEIRADLDGAPVYGIIDRVDQSADGLIVSDYKSGKAPAWEDEREEKLGQLRTYAAMLEANGRHVTELRLLFVSPQLAAGAKLERCESEASAALTRLADALPGRAPQALLRAVMDIETAHRRAREASAPATSRQAADAAADASAAVAGDALGGGGDIKALLLDAFAARRKAFFARRTANAAQPTTVSLVVQDADLDRARAEASGIWAAATACYEAWDFPGQTGTLCDWCPFASQCEAFLAWDAAGRPPASSGT